MRAPAYSPKAGRGRTEGTYAARLSETFLGLDLFPWQRLVLDRGLEREGGRWKWRTVVVSVARQNGKSSLLRALGLHRMMRGETVGAMSHLRSVGREVMFDPLSLALDSRTWRDSLDTRSVRTNGQESLSLGATGGRLVMPSASEKGAHGYSLDLAIVDEAWALHDYRVPQAITPTQVARPDPQLWIVSTAGTADSLWLRELVEAGRAGTDRVALFEWSAPLELEAADVDAWLAANPAVGHTIDLEEIGHAYATATTAESRAEFERAHLNRWTAGVEQIIPAAAWRACLAPDVNIGDELCFGFDVALDRSAAAIVAAGVVGERVAVEVVAYRPGVDWLIPALIGLRDRFAPLAIVANDSGPARSVVEEAGTAGLALEPYGAGAYVAACQVFYDLTTEGRLAHRGQAELDEAARAVGRRPLGESWAFGRAKSAADISALVGATVAAHRASRPRVLPRLVTG